jgi:hypothetical protein
MREVPTEIPDVIGWFHEVLSGLPEDTARDAITETLFACFDQEQLRQIADVLHDYCYRRAHIRPHIRIIPESPASG